MNEINEIVKMLDTIENDSIKKNKEIEHTLSNLSSRLPEWDFQDIERLRIRYESNRILIERLSRLKADVIDKFSMEK